MQYDEILRKKEELIRKADAMFRKVHETGEETQEEWQKILDGMLELNAEAKKFGKEPPFEPLGHLEMVGMMADETGWPREKWKSDMFNR